jgi:WXG100 family type VII secretion target
MATYGVDPKNLLDTGGELRQATYAISDALGVLDGAVNTYRSTNSGATADAFGAAQADWQRGVQDMNTSLVSGATALDDIAEIYHLVDKSGAAGFPR